MLCLTRWSLFFLFLAAGAAPVFAQPSVFAIQNNYSGTKPGLPSYGISPGSLFVIAGSNLAATANTAELSGTSVSLLPETDGAELPRSN